MHQLGAIALFWFLGVGVLRTLLWMSDTVYWVADYISENRRLREEIAALKSASQSSHHDGKEGSPQQVMPAADKPA